MLGSKYSQPISGLVALVAAGLSGYGIYTFVHNRSTSKTSSLTTLSSTHPQATSLLPFLLADNPLTIVNNPVLQHVQRYGLPALPLTTAATNVSISSLPLTAASYAYPLFIRDTYVCAYNTHTRNPDWVLEYIGDSTHIQYFENAQDEDLETESASRDKSAFKSEPFLVPPFRVSPSALLGTGYDRGHLVPAANARTTQHAMNDTFYLSNISPQSPSLNRNYWRSLESFTRSLTREFHDVFVISGTLFMPKEEIVIESAKKPSPKRNNSTEPPPAVVVDSSNKNSKGNAVNASLSPEELAQAEETVVVPQRTSMQIDVIKSNSPPILVPTHFYKIIVAMNLKSNPNPSSSSDTAFVASFAVPNAHVHNSTPLRSYSIPIETIENYSGYRFFPLLPRNGSKSITNETNKVKAKAIKNEEKSNTSAVAKLDIDIRDLCSQVDCELGKFHEDGRRWLERKKSLEKKQASK